MPDHGAGVREGGDLVDDDPQGRAVAKALRRLETQNVDDVRIGKHIELTLSGERAERQRQLGAVIDGYEQFRDFDRTELALIEPLRTLRLIHYSAWLARRWQDPAFPRAFPWFGTSDYWTGQVRMLEEQIEAMGERALVV